MREIPLTHGKVALIDDEDYDAVSRYKWQARQYRGSWHARRRATAHERRNGASDRVWLHRSIMQSPPDKKIDHKNGNGLDCRRENMRVATNSQNQHNTKTARANNTSGFKGVHWEGRAARWVAQIRLRGKHIYIGSYTDLTTAAHAYDAKAKELHGEFARVNFP